MLQISPVGVKLVHVYFIYLKDTANYCGFFFSFKKRHTSVSLGN